jgi:LysM repeat protein
MTDKPRLPEDEKQKEKKKKFYLTIFIVLLLLASFYLFWSALTTNPEEKAKESQSTPTTETTSQEAQKQEEYTIYKVQSGDTLFSIAKKFNVKMDDIIKLNNLEDPNKLQVGQELKIPAVPTTQPTNQKSSTSQEQP